MQYFVNKKSTLRLTPEVFDCLHSELIKKFSIHYSINVDLLTDFQVYGFDNYHEENPNMRTYIHTVISIWVNGKYLYNKVRDFKNGKREIKLTREYVYLYFQVVGYKDVFEFIQSPIVDVTAQQQQLQLCGVAQNNAEDRDYYVGYYFGEDYEIIKTKLTLYDNYSKVLWVLVYWEKKNEPSLYTYHGVVTEVKATMSLYFKANHASTERSALISVFVGNRNIENKPFLFGTYAGFDRNDCPVAGEIIFQRVTSEKEQEKLTYLREVDFEILDLITNKRIVSNVTLPQSQSELSQDSMYASRLSIYSGEYTGYMLTNQKEDTATLNLTIEIKSNKARLIFDDGRVYKGYFRVVCRGTLLLGSFGLLASCPEFSLLLNANFHKKNYILGVYFGLDNHNSPSVGRIFFEKKPDNKKAHRACSHRLKQYLFPTKGQEDMGLDFKHII